jgi:Ser-tRNA(Ala) deacylase AlaX
MEGICINFNEKIKENKRVKIVIMTKKELQEKIGILRSRNIFQQNLFIKLLNIDYFY